MRLAGGSFVQPAYKIYYILADLDCLVKSEEKSKLFLDSRTANVGFPPRVEKTHVAEPTEPKAAFEVKTHVKLPVGRTARFIVLSY